MQAAGGRRGQDLTRRAIASEASFTLAVALSPSSAIAPATQWPRCSSSSPSATDCRALAPGFATCYKIAMSVSMGYMLVTMI